MEGRRQRVSGQHQEIERVATSQEVNSVSERKRDARREGEREEEGD